MGKKFNWKAWLRINLLTKDVSNDYIAEVSTVGNAKRNEDVADRIVLRGSEYQRGTILNILNMGDEIKAEFLQEGSSVIDGIARHTPRVLGSWVGSSAKFDPAVHKKTLDSVLTNEMQKKLDDNVDVETLGVKNSGAYIGLVTDLLTRRTDDTITPGEEIRIDGDKIKILPEGYTEFGVFFIDEDGTEHPVGRAPLENNPKKVIVRVPALPAGEYTLRIVTRFSNNSTLLNEPRSIDYERMLIVL